jgi:hypothetical protein
VATPEWRALLALLPVGADSAWFKAEFGRIAAQTPAELERQRKVCLEQVRKCDEALADLPIGIGAVRDQVFADRTANQTRADRQRRQWQAWRYVELLILAKRAGVSLSYTSAKVPRGHGINYLRCATAVWGRRCSSHTARRLLKWYRKRQPADSLMMGQGGLSTDAMLFPKIVEDDS